MRHKIMLATLVPILMVLNYGIYSKEQIKTHGETILLELAPVDPRSLMQGDYMQLRYALEQTSYADTENIQDLPKRGYLVVKPNAQQVAEFIRFDNGQPLATDEKRIRYHQSRYNHIRIVPNSFLFQEGHAKHYDNARYGVFKINSSGDKMLIGLADKTRQLIVVQDESTQN